MTIAPRPGAQRLSTRSYLLCAALGAIQAMTIIFLTPVNAAAASFAPPLYALLSALSIVFINLAARLLPSPVAALLTAALTCLMVVPFSSLGFLIALPLLSQGAAIALILWLTRHRSAWRYLVAGGVAGIVAFFVALPVFSTDDLTPAVLVSTLAARIAAGVGSALLAGALAKALRAAGIGPRSPRSATSSDK